MMPNTSLRYRPTSSAKASSLPPWQRSTSSSSVRSGIRVLRLADGIQRPEDPEPHAVRPATWLRCFTRALKQFPPAPSLNALSIAEEVAVVFRDLILTLIPVLTMVGLFGLAALWLSRRSRLHELAHRERLAMIERGLVPPVELQGSVMEFP